MSAPKKSSRPKLRPKDLKSKRNVDNFDMEYSDRTPPIIEFDDDYNDTAENPHTRNFRGGGKVMSKGMAKGGRVMSKGMHQMPDGSMMADDDPSMRGMAKGGKVMSKGMAKGGKVMSKGMAKGGRVMSKGMAKGGRVMSKGMAKGGRVMSKGMAKGGRVMSKGLKALKEERPDVVAQMGYRRGDRVMSKGGAKGGVRGGLSRRADVRDNPNRGKTY